VKHKKKLAAFTTMLAFPAAGHLAIDRAVRFEPPAVAAPAPAARADEHDGVRRAGRGWSTRRGVRVVALAGSPEEIGAQHAALLHDGMVANEAVLWSGFRHMVPFRPARALLFDLARLEYRNVDRGFPEERRRELAAESQAFAPDPHASEMPTYPRMVFLHALYDIALGFERSPLLACTSFGLAPSVTDDGHALFARAFDFEAADIFDRDKVVFVVREDGRIPLLSVAWPGLVGVLTGMNAEGVALAVHGGRARTPAASGMPVVFSLRDVLGRAHDAREAAEMLATQPVMVSHLVFVGDASGRFLVVERAPGADATIREASAVTNHFEGPLAGDPADVRVRATTTTLPRRARVDELLRRVTPGSANVERAVAILRDHGCAGDAACPPGDRRAIDAFIATHGVVFDLEARAAWVSEGPHLSGAFTRVALGDQPSAPTVELPADPALVDGRYAAGRARAGGPMFQEKP
jgi:hypothetical protein